MKIIKFWTASKAGSNQLSNKAFNNQNSIVKVYAVNVSNVNVEATNVSSHKCLYIYAFFKKHHQVS